MEDLVTSLTAAAILYLIVLAIVAKKLPAAFLQVLPYFAWSWASKCLSPFNGSQGMDRQQDFLERS